MINEREYNLLMRLESRWKWLVREESGLLMALSVMEKPEKNYHWETWKNGYFRNLLYNFNDYFNFIKWEDDEPHIIKNLITEYELNKNLIDMGKKIIDEINKENQFKKPIKIILEKNQPSEILTELNNYKKCKNKYLDESEIEKIVDNYLYKRDMSAVDNALIYRNNLNEKIVIEKPTIPIYVSEWIKHVIDLTDSISYLMNYDNIRNFSHPLTLWCYESGNNDNLKKLALAYIYGYYIEEEKYYVLDQNNRTMLYKNLSNEIQLSNGHLITIRSFNESYALTEKEIKDFDEWYFKVAISVEEYHND